MLDKELVVQIDLQIFGLDYGATIYVALQCCQQKVAPSYEL